MFRGFLKSEGSQEGAGANGYSKAITQVSNTTTLTNRRYFEFHRYLYSISHPFNLEKCACVFVAAKYLNCTCTEIRGKRKPSRAGVFTGFLGSLQLFLPKSLSLLENIESG